MENQYDQTVWYSSISNVVQKTGKAAAGKRDEGLVNLNFPAPMVV
jgi:hypothetical protein